ncbi:MAG: hypothetical protein JNM86_01265 [Phycisphaerae bacterium]|nr:hypothetical protein [Phycisphaerae bacterium]
MTTRTGSSPLRIHLCHPLGKTTKWVRDLSDALDGLGGGAVTVSHSAGFQLDQHWHVRAGEALRSAHWLVIVFGERSLDRDWWLWEAGYFAATHAGASRSAVCFHHPSLNVPRALHAWRPIPATVSNADSLIREILETHQNHGGRSLVSNVGEKGLRVLCECIVHCCVPALPEVPESAARVG